MCTHTCPCPQTQQKERNKKHFSDCNSMWYTTKIKTFSGYKRIVADHNLIWRNSQWQIKRKFLQIISSPDRCFIRKFFCLLFSSTATCIRKCENFLPFINYWCGENIRTVILIKMWNPLFWASVPWCIGNILAKLIWTK